MYKSKYIEKRNNKIRRFAFFFAVLMLFCSVFSLFNYPFSNIAADAEDSTTSTDNRKLQNGSFEERQTFTGNYSQPDQSAVPSWNTTAFQGKIELFKKNTGTYIPGVTLEPTDGNIAAELNADEESTLYQTVKTTPSSVYEWGLDHGARNGTDTMALVIGPKQSVNPSKPSKEGRDQFMQMVDWLITQGKTSVKTSAGVGEHLTVYSKKFATSGTFEDNAGNNAFSLTPSTIYTEEWHIWIMASSRATSGTNPWNSYGSNAEGSAGSTDGTEVDLNKYYLYTVPAGQTETLFGFVSVGYDKSSTSADKAKTYGNFLDNINFQIYHPLSSSTTNHGSAVIGGSDGTTEGEGGSKGHEVTIDNKLATYVLDGEPLKIQAIIKKADVDDGCEFVGLYYTNQNENGNPETVFLKLSGNEIEDTGSLTDDEKTGKWIKSTNTDGDIIYTYYLENVTSATDLHFVFIKSPTITYDPNGGKEYKVYEGEREYNKDEADNVYSFKPATGIDNAQAETETLFIPPYVSHAAEGQNDGWKFMGWLLTGDIIDNVSTNIQVNADKLGSLLLPAEHTVACDYTFAGINGDSKAQYFKTYNGNVTLTKQINNDNDKDVGVTWTDNGETKTYANIHKGLTMVAQWRWRQAFIPQVEQANGTYIDLEDGGTVEITSVTDTSNENYNANYNATGGKSYYATTDETITVKATAKDGYNFLGWYDANGNLLTTNTVYTYVEKKEAVNTYYARFSNSVTQTYIRQVKNGDNWEDTTDDKIGTLGRYTYTDAVGKDISSTATAKDGYKFIGWYDSEGNKVADDMLINNGATISYTTTGDATYYARFEKVYTQTYIRQVGSGDNWEETDADEIGTLEPYGYIDVLNTDVSSKATAKDGYKFVGWYDGKDNNATNVTDDTTISYKITGDATYYARFQATITQTFIRQVWNNETKTWEDTTDDKIGTLNTYTHTDVVNKNVSSTATANGDYEFIGWFNSEGNPVNYTIDDGATISYTTTEDATYYARFSLEYTQTYIRQIWNSTSNSWEATNDDKIGTLNPYSNTGVADTVVSSTATANESNGYKFVGWYDGNDDNATKVSQDDDTTITHTITGNTTYYARFKAIVTQKFIPQIWNGEEWETITNDNIGTVSPDHHTDVVGETANSTATAGTGYKFIGWYDEDGKQVSDTMLTNDGATISYTTTGNATYYARFEKVYTLNVNKIDDNKNPLANAEFTLYQEDSKGEEIITYNGEKIQCTIVSTATTILNEDNTESTAVFELTFSPDVVYYLNETESPQGYQGINTPLKITFDDSGNVIIDEPATITINDNVINIEIVNHLMLHLPETGTTFTSDMCVVTGFSILALATIGLVCRKIRRYNQK